MSSWTARRHLLGVLALGLAAGCGDDPVPERPPDVLLVTVDTTRADRVRPEVMPAWSAFADAGVRFEQAQTTSPITLPAHATVLTGLPPYAHGVRNNGTWRAADELELLAERFRAAGYATGAVIAAMPLHSQYGLDQGFDRYDEGGLERSEGGFVERSAEDVTAVALELLAELPAPRMVWVHYFDPHRPWEAPAPFRDRFDDPYDAELAYVDHHLSRLLEAVGDDAVVALTSDHGEGLGEHGELTHGMMLHDATLRVPLALRAPELQPAVVSEPVSLVDLAPALLELAGVDGPTRSVLRPDGQPVYAETYMGAEAFGAAPGRTVATDGHRLVRTLRDRLFDRSVPAAERDEVPGPSELHDSLAAALDTHEQAGGALGTRAEGELEALSALGYVWSEATEEAVFDIYDRPELLGWSSRLLEDEELVDGELLLARLADEHHEAVWVEALTRASPAALAPVLPVAQERVDRLRVQALVASNAAEQGQLALADRAYARAKVQFEAERAAGRVPEASAVAVLATLALDRDEGELAVQLGAELRSRSFHVPDLLGARARVLHRLGDLDAAIVDYTAASALSDPDAALWRDMAYALAAAGQLARAHEVLEHAVALDPTDPTANERLAALTEMLEAG